MENRKDIGKAFREKLEGLERSPRDGVWRSLNTELATQRKDRFIAIWLRNIGVTGIIVLLLTLFTFPLWENHVPHIYLVMPNEKREGINGDARDANATLENRSGTAVNPGTRTESSTDSNNDITLINDSDNVSSKNSNAIGSRSSKGINGSVSNISSGTNKGSHTSGKTGTGINTLAGNSARSMSGGAESGSANDDKAIAGSGKNKQGADKLNNRTGNSLPGKSTEIKGRESENSNSTTTIRGNSGKDDKKVSSGSSTINTDKGNTVNPNGSKSTGSTENSTVKTSGSTSNRTVVDNNNSNNAVSGNEKSSTANNRSNSTVNNGTNSSSGIENNTTVNPVSASDSLSIAAATNETTDSLSVAEVKHYQMDFAKVADSLRELYGREEKTADKKKGDTIPYKKLYVYAFAAPMQFALPKSGGYLDNSLRDMNATSKTSFAFGGYLGYNITRKLSIRVGAIKTKGEVVTNDILLETTFIEHEPTEENPQGWLEIVPPANFSGVEYNEGVSGDTIAEQLGDTEQSDFPTALVNVRSNFEFLEVPVELTYRLYEGKFGIGLISGFVTGYTKENSVFAENELGSIQIGKMKHLEEVSHAVSFGGSFHYNIMPNLQLNVEPVYKYYFNSTQFVRPHTYSIQFGLRYDFGFWNKRK